MFRVRWLGNVAFDDAHALQRGLFANSGDDYLLLLEHPHVFTLGVRAKPEHVLVDAGSVGAAVVRTDRGGDVTYHGPGQLVGYPIVSVPGPMADTRAYVHGIEQLVIDALRELGMPGADRLPGYPGVWVAIGSAQPRKIAAIGVRLTRGRSMHGFAINVDPDLGFFAHIVPCGLVGKAVSSMAAEGVSVTMREVVDVVVEHASRRWGAGGVDRQDLAWRVDPSDQSAFTRGAAVGRAPVRLLGRLAEAGVGSGMAIEERKPAWLRRPAVMGTEFRALKSTMRALDLVTVCEEAGCPNIYECWAEGTATFMLNGDRCTRACGFCLVDTRRPEPIDSGEPDRVARAVVELGLGHAVITAVARDDLADGGASQFVATIAAVRAQAPDTTVEVLIPDCKGDAVSLSAIFDAGPDILNHNIETVARLQRAVRPSASYGRSLAVLARAKAGGLVTKSGIILGMGEYEDEVHSTLADLRSVGVDIVTMGQYLRPTAHHLPVARWWTPAEFDRVRTAAHEMGFAHVEASPLTRSSYHAAAAASSTSAPATTR